MVETNTTDLSLNYTTSGYVDIGENTEYECLRLPPGLMVFAGVCMGISLCGLVWNGIVMYFLGFDMKKSPFTVYILNLAVADFSLLLLFFLLLLAIFSLISFCSYLSHFIHFYNNFVTVVEFVSHFFDLSSLGLLTVISVERCVSVLFPLWYRCRRPKHLSSIVSGVIWALAGCFVSSMYLSLKLAEGYETAFAGVAIAIYITLSLMIFISNLFLFIKLCCGSQRRHPGKLYVAVLLNVIFFFVLGIPFGVEIFLSLPSSRELSPENVPLLLALLNCSINPVIYFLVGSCQKCRFQGSMKVALRRVFQEKAVSEDESRAPGDTAVETTV